VFSCRSGPVDSLRVKCLVLSWDEDAAARLRLRRGLPPSPKATEDRSLRYERRGKREDRGPMTEDSSTSNQKTKSKWQKLWNHYASGGQALRQAQGRQIQNSIRGTYDFVAFPFDILRTGGNGL
jgi:hypothetical protein